MSYVRGQLQVLVSEWFSEPPGVDEDTELVNRILERFDVTPKPVIGNAELGSYVRTADEVGATNDQKGERMLTYLTKSGLRIVRVDDES
jgi:hypothetical protein